MIDNATIETIAIAIQATLDSVRCSPEPISGEEALRMLDERLQDDGLDLRIQFERPVSSDAMRKRIFIVKGAMGPEPHEGHKEGDLEWQFSDGPSGKRGSSDDFADLRDGLEAHRGCAFNIDEADFTEAEHQVFVQFCAEEALVSRA